MRNITLTDNKLSFTHDAYVADIDSYAVDVSPLTDDNGSVADASIVIKSGSITASTPVTSGNIISFNITQSSDSDACFVLKITFTNGQVRNVLFKINALLDDLETEGDCYYG